MYRNKSLSLIKRSAAFVAGAMALLATSAGAQSPAPLSPNTATPFSWPAFHAGRYENPSTTDVFLNQLLGTPSGRVPTGNPAPLDFAWTQIPSFLLGNYNPAAPPGALGATAPYDVVNADVHNFRPNTFNQQYISYWLAPYAYADALSGGALADDQDTAPAFTETGGWAITNSTTATGGKYQAIAVVPDPAAATATAVWTLTVPTSGSYSILAHLPISVPNAATGAHYTIQYNNGAAVTENVIRSQVFGGTVSLLPPVFLVGGTTVTVTLDNIQSTSAVGALVIADSVSILSVAEADRTVDEDNTFNTAGAAFSTPTGTWTATTTPETAGSASHQSYLRTPAAAPAGSAATATAVWQYKPTLTGLYQVSFHIPNSDLLSITDAAKEFRITDAHYVVTVTSGGVTRTVVNVKKSQTEATGASPLGSAFSVRAGDTIKVTLSNETSNTKPAAANAAAGLYVVADTVTFSHTSGAVVDSSPVAINATEYPEIQNALYQGVLAGTVTTVDPVKRGGVTTGDHSIRQLVYFGRNETLTSAGTDATTDDNDATNFTKAGTWTTETGTAAADTAENAEYQTASVSGPSLSAAWKIPVATSGVYSIEVHLPIAAPNAVTAARYVITYNNGAAQTFTVVRSQADGGDVTLLNSVFLAGATTVTVKLDNTIGSNDKNALLIADSASITSASNRVGRVYCVDGLTGGVVWRYTLPTIDTANGAVGTNTEIHSTPAIARFNVITSDNGSTSLTKNLCVVVSDNGGHVYCLDAVGNKDGTSIDPASAGVGTTNAFWIWRPNQNQVKTIQPNGSQDDSKPDNTTFDSSSDMFAPSSFATASPTVFVDSTTGQGTVYIGNSNGVLYALDATGVPAYTGTKDISPYLGSVHLLSPTNTLLTTPTVKPLWWFSVSGSNAGGEGSAAIESAPALDYNGSAVYRIYFGSSHEQGSATNYGRVYAVDSTGPTPPPNSPNPTMKPGTKGYNTSIASWEFPRARDLDTTRKIRPALGSISGSPVVYRYPGAAATSIYFAANAGAEIPAGSNAGTAPSRDTSGTTGRIWSIQPGSDEATFNWAYPSTTDPNNVAFDTTIQTTLPIGGFIHATPAVGVVGFPQVIEYDPLAPKNYQHVDSVNTGANGVRGQNVPMLYVGTAGDDNAMYAIDLLGGNDSERGLYRVPAPNGSRFESSPALVVNANNPPNTGGSGGMVYCTAGTFLYQFSATPLSNNQKDALDPTKYQQFARIAADAIFGNCGPVSSPTLAAADVFDISSTAVADGLTSNTTDWLYVGDTTTGLAKGLTPSKQFGGFDPGTIIPNPPFDPPGGPTNPVPAYSPIETLHIHIFDGSTSHPFTSTDMNQENKVGDPLPQFEWGSNAYIRVSNIVPANPNDADLTLRVPDPDNPGYYFTDGQPVSVQIGDVGPTITANDPRTIPNINGPPALPIAPATAIALPSDGFYGRSDGSTLDPLADANGVKWFGALTYGIRDGTGSLNTPGSMRRVTLARQTAQVRTIIGGQSVYVGTVTLQSQIGNTQVDPTFGILNPLALDGGAKNLVTGATLNSGVMGAIGPNTASPPPAIVNDALANGNSVYESAIPPNGYSIGGADPTNPSAGTGGSAATTYKTIYKPVVTATGEINHGSSGTNSGLLGVSDRSQLPLTGGALKIRMEQSPLNWNDTTGQNGSGATINPLPWESMPISYGFGANRSPDYPDVPSNGVGESLKYFNGSPTTNLNTSSALVTVPNGRFATNSITLSVHAPKYQPANLTGGLATGVANGYRNRVRVYVDSNQNSVWDFGEAYRDVDLQSGVLADMSTSIVENTTDVGAVPQGFGLHTDAYANLGPFLPPVAPFLPATVPPAGDYGQFFKPVTVHNNGNVNLVNAQFDQKIYQLPQDPNNPNPHTVALLSESTESTSSIPAFDKDAVTGVQRYLVRSSIDHDLAAVAQNPILTGKYPGVTFHKARVGDGAPTKLQVPDRSPDDFTPSNDPFVSVAVPFGTPTGTYHQSLRLFEGMDALNYNWLEGPKYGGLKAGHDTIAPNASGVYDGFALVSNGNKLESVQPYSEPGTTIKVTVTEARLTKNKIFGDLPMIDDAGASTGSNYLPSAFRDLFWGTGVGGPSGTGKVSLLWTSTRTNPAASSASLWSTALPGLGSILPLNGFAADSASSWFAPPVVPTAVAGLNAGASVTQEQHVYDATGDRFISSGAAYGFYGNLVGSATDLICSKVDMASGVPMLTGTASDITQNDHVTPKYGVHGLKVSSSLSGSGITFPSANGGANTISEDLWAFWYTGARGGSSIQYSATTTTNGGDLTGTWRNPATLPIPAGLSAVSDPSAVLIPGATPQIQVTYTGVSPDGNSDIYVSHYQPYHPYKADPVNGALTNGVVPDDTKVGLLLMSMPSINEYLQPDATNLWWQARDVAWLRMTTLPISINTTPLAAATAPTYDRASGLLTFTGVTGGPNASQTVYIDLARGRVRFRPSLPKNSVVSATFQPQAKRITTDTLADSAATTILDEAFKYNDDGIGSRISAARMWYIYRKSGGAEAGVKPSLFYKTQRLTVDLHDVNNRGVSLKLTPTGRPIVTVAMAGVGTIYDYAGLPASVDIDWKRGRLYFPLNIGGVSCEGKTVTVNFTYDDKSANGAAGPQIVSDVQWLDEERGTDISSPSTESKSGGTDSSERAIPMKTIVNESGVTAFLDPSAYANVFKGSYQYDVPSAGYIKKSTDLPHNIWLFWSSNRNGAGDLYSEVLNPRFSSDTP